MSEEEREGERAAEERAEERAAAAPQMCVVCLEERVSSTVRCRGGSCAARVCATCHADARGLCPICDRGPINARYPCVRCMRLTPLREYGYQCISCHRRSLCKTCYTDFRECHACESV